MNVDDVLQRMSANGLTEADMVEVLLQDPSLVLELLHAYKAERVLTRTYKESWEEVKTVLRSQRLEVHALRQQLKLKEGAIEAYYGQLNQMLEEDMPSSSGF